MSSTQNDVQTLSDEVAPLPQDPEHKRGEIVNEIQARRWFEGDAHLLPDQSNKCAYNPQQSKRSCVQVIG